MNKALAWMDERQSFAPDRPFLMYWAPGAVARSAPHLAGVGGQIQRQVRRRLGRLPRARLHAQMTARLDHPAGTKLTPRDETMAAWADIPETSAPSSARHGALRRLRRAHRRAGRPLRGRLEQRGLRENTLILYIVGDNGSSSEGQQGSISELLAQNNIPNTVDQQLAALEKLGGLAALGSPKTDNMYHAGWAWAGQHALQEHQARRRALRRHAQSAGRLVAEAHQAGQGRALAVHPRRGHRADDLRPARHHAAEIRERPRADQMDGHSFAATFDKADAPAANTEQFFDNNGSRAIYKDGWYACAFGPFIPWNSPAAARARQWDSATDEWELYNLKDDFSQANDLAASNPEEARGTAESSSSPSPRTTRPSPSAPATGCVCIPRTGSRRPTELDLRRQHPPHARVHRARPRPRKQRGGDRHRMRRDASGVLYALGGSGGGLALYMDKGHLVYLYNMMIIERYTRARRRRSPPASTRSS